VKDLVHDAAPFVEIRIPLEGSPTLRYVAMSAEDAERLRLWLVRRRDLRALIDAADCARRRDAA